MSLNCGHSRPVVHPPGDIYEYGEPRQNDIDSRKQKNSEKNCPSATSSTTKSIWTGPVPNPGLCGERQLSESWHGPNVQWKFSREKKLCQMQAFAKARSNVRYSTLICKHLNKIDV
jgi:hypothetical protein